MRLGIVSDCVHFITPSGEVGTENHILLRQLKALSEYFDSVIMCCPFDIYKEGSSYSVYASGKFKFVQVPNRGGSSLKSKFQLVATVPTWWKAFKKVDKESDIVYQRFPNNLNIPGFFYFYFKQKKVFATYTGSWDSDNEPKSYLIQKHLLKNYFKGPVWVYTTRTQTQPQKIHSGFSPSYSIAEWEEETAHTEQRLSELKLNSIKCLKLVTVGKFIGYKNQQYILDACKIAADRGIPFHLTMVGDGPLKYQYADFITKHKLQQYITIAGRKTYPELREIYRQSNFTVQAPLAEGFGKVPIEGFFHGAIPIINNISLASYMTGDGKRGFTFTATDPNNLVQVFEKILANPASIASMIVNGRSFAKTQTLEAWAEEYYKTITEYFG